MQQLIAALLDDFSAGNAHLVAKLMANKTQWVEPSQQRLQFLKR
ncbi:hypothetical protein [Nitrincola alkalilacustris]|nr:hypothetical protein [Nitrincola alkalilacustris]